MQVPEPAAGASPAADLQVLWLQHVHAHTTTTTQEHIAGHCMTLAETTVWLSDLDEGAAFEGLTWKA